MIFQVLTVYFSIFILLLSFPSFYQMPIIQSNEIYHSSTLIWPFYLKEKMMKMKEEYSLQEAKAWGLYQREHQIQKLRNILLNSSELYCNYLLMSTQLKVLFLLSSLWLLRKHLQHLYPSLSICFSMNKDPILKLSHHLLLLHHYLEILCSLHS